MMMANKLTERCFISLVISVNLKTGCKDFQKLRESIISKLVSTWGTFSLQLTFWRELSKVH